MAKERKQNANLKPIRKGDLSEEELKKRQHNGGVKSGEVRRQQRDAKASARYILNLASKNAVKANLEELGVEAGELTNMNALHARLFNMAMNGDIEAYKQLIKIAGYEPEENRKERESLAKVDALASRGLEANVSVALNEDEDSNDVIFYLPQKAKEEDLLYHEEDEKKSGDKK